MFEHQNKRRWQILLTLPLLFLATGCNTLFPYRRQPREFSEKDGWQGLGGWNQQQDGESISSRRSSRRNRPQDERPVDDEQNPSLSQRSAKERSAKDRKGTPDRSADNADLVKKLQHKTPKEFQQQMSEIQPDDPFVTNLLAVQAQALKDHIQNPPDEEESPADRTSQFGSGPRNSLRSSEYPLRRRSSRRSPTTEPKAMLPPADARPLDDKDRASQARPVDDRQPNARRSLDDNEDLPLSSRRTDRNAPNRMRDKDLKRRTDRGGQDFSSRQTKHDSQVNDAARPSKRTRDSRKRKHQWREQLNLAIADLQDKLKDKDLDPRQSARMEVSLRLMSVAAGHKEDALATVKGIPEPWQEFWKNIGHGLFIAMDAAEGPIGHRHAARALRPIREAKRQLATISSLDVRNASFCKKVVGFGEFTPFVPTRFTADQEVLLYVEVDNFVAEKKQKGFETELSGVYQILDSAGHRVSEYELPVDKQVCRNHRRDYFIAYRMHMPKKIALGSYKLQLTIQDIKGKKYGHATLPFEIAKR